MKVLTLLLSMSLWPALSQEKTAKLVSLRLEPHSATLRGAQASQRFVALGKYTDGMERDVTSRCVFTLSEAASRSSIIPRESSLWPMEALF